MISRVTHRERERERERESLQSSLRAEIEKFRRISDLYPRNSILRVLNLEF